MTHSLKACDDKGAQVVCYTISPKQISLATEEDIACTLAANDYKEPQTVCYENENTARRDASPVLCIDMGGGKPQCDFLKELSPTLTCTHCGAPVIAAEASNENNKF